MNYSITRKDTSRHIQTVGLVFGWDTQPAIYVYGFCIANLFTVAWRPEQGWKNLESETNNMHYKILHVPYKISRYKTLSVKLGVLN
jgi:hypothetical protein